MSTAQGEDEPRSADIVDTTNVAVEATDGHPAALSITSRRTEDEISPLTLETTRTRPRTSHTFVRRKSMTFKVKTFGENKFAALPIQSAFSKIAGMSNVSSNDTESWLGLLGKEPMAQPTTEQEAFDLEMATLGAGENLVKNNASTKNFNSILLFLLSELRAMRLSAYEGTWSAETYNALFMFRVLTKYLIEHLSPTGLHHIFEMDRIPKGADSMPPSPISDPTFKKPYIDMHVIVDRRQRAEVLLEELFHVIIYAYTDSLTQYQFYVEVQNLLIVLFSSQMMYRLEETKDQPPYFLNIAQTRLSHFGRATIARLFSNFISQQPNPTPPSGVLSSAYSYIFSTKKIETAPFTAASLIADKSVLLILILTNQDEKASTIGFRNALCELCDMNVSTEAPDDDGILPEEGSLNISFAQLYDLLCENLVEESALLLYSLMVKNNRFRSYVLSRTDPDSLMIPILRLLYEYADSKHRHCFVYILLNILLLCSQDGMYNESIQKITVPAQLWYSERLIKTFSLGGLSMLVLMRCIQTNLGQQKDMYIHTVGISILSNMSSRITNVQPAVAQRIISLFDSVAKRYLKLIQADPNHTETDSTVYSDLVALILEMVNSIISHNIQHNPQLVYALLHRRKLFFEFREERFAPLVDNIDAVITYFVTKLDDFGSRTPSAEDILAMIEQGLKTWPANKIKVYEEVRCEYEEAAEYSRFFLPYAWSLVFRHSLIYWDDERSELLQEMVKMEGS
ncbi:Dymeclin [Cladochytrium replicatum]|nr:Dymeclin [Cladochytrium replicatum]